MKSVRIDVSKGKSTIALLRAFGSVLAEATAASVEEIEGALEEKQDKANAVPVMISPGGWKSSGETAYPYRYNIAVEGVTANDRAQVTIAPDSVEAALSCHLCPSSETLAGVIRLRAASVPDAEIVAEYEMKD